MTSRFKLILTALILLLISSPIFAQESNEDKPETQKIEYYTLGDKCFSINLGLFIPLFFFDPTPGDSNAFSETNLNLGGKGSLAFDVYLNNNVKVGLEAGGMFATSPNDNYMFMIPITARIGYEFHFGPFSLPVYLGSGINIIKYNDDTTVQFLLKPGVSFYWNYNSDWAFGANLVYWWAPEINSDNHSQDRIGNFLDFTISAEYHF